MTNEKVDLSGDNERWLIRTSSGVEAYFGRFIMDSLGRPIWFQTSDREVIFLGSIISVQREIYSPHGLRKKGQP